MKLFYATLIAVATLVGIVQVADGQISSRAIWVDSPDGYVAAVNNSNELLVYDAHADDGTDKTKVCDASNSNDCVTVSSGYMRVQSGLVDVTSAITQIPIEHHMVHRGAWFEHNDGYSLGNSDYKRMKIVTPNAAVYVHLSFDVTASVSGILKFYETGTYTNGTQEYAVNHSRNSTYASQTTLYDVTAVTSYGTLLEMLYVGGSNHARGGGTGSRPEFVLKTNTTYLLEFQSTGSSNLVNVHIDYYERGLNTP